MRTIPLTRGYVAVVDDEDFEHLSRFRWHVRIDPRKHVHYAARNEGAGERNLKGRGFKQRLVFMHRQILGITERNVQVDHKNRDGLDNRRANLRANLRVCANSQNQANAKKRAGSSAFKGVTWSPEHGRWRARIGLEGRRVALGLFDDEEAAARAYDSAAREFFGEFARLNFPDEDPAPFDHAALSDRTRPAPTSDYPGVHWHRETSRWRARVRRKDKRVYLGQFDTEADAIRAIESFVVGAGS